MTLPTLTPCPKPDCRAPITHYHGNSSGDIYACTSSLNGRPCPHGQDSPCYAPRETAPLLVPDVDTVARMIYESDDYPTNSWATQSEDVKDEYRRNAQAILDLIAAHQPVWKRVEPGTLIKAGTRYRRETLNGSSWERIAAGDFLSGDGSISIDPRTIPAEPEDPRVAVVLEFLDQTEPETHERDARELLARIDALGGEGK